MAEKDVEEALLMVAEARRKLAVRTRWPFPRHAAAGGVVGAMVASAGLPPALMAIAMGACLSAVFAIKEYDRRQDGFFVSGYQAGRTRWVALLILSLSIGALAVALYAKSAYGWWAAPLIAGVIVFVIATCGSIVWEMVNRADLARST